MMFRAFLFTHQQKTPQNDISSSKRSIKVEKSIWSALSYLMTVTMDLQ